MRKSPALFVLMLGSLSMTAQTQKEQPAAGCPAQPNTILAMRNCYRPLLVFAPAMNDPHLLQQFHDLKAQAEELKSRDVLYVPVVPEGHNQPVPKSALRTAALSEDELAAVRDHFKVEPEDFLVILIGKDGGEKLNSRTPVTVEKMKELIDSMPMRRQEMKRSAQP